MTPSLRVELVAPLPADRWLSIERYVQAIEANAPGSMEVTRARQPSVACSSLVARARARYRDYPATLATAAVEADVVHVVDQALAHVLRTFGPGPAVVTCHDLMPLLLPGHSLSSFERWFDLTLLRRSLDAMRHATRIIAISRQTAADLESLLAIPKGRIDIVPNMLHDAYQACLAPEAEEWLEEQGIRLGPPPRILSVGRTEPYKNLEAAIPTLAAPGLEDTTLVRVGPKLTPAQAALARHLGVEHRITELGHQEPETLARVYAACDVLLQPSFYEGFGVPVVEAMACGLPVVCSDGGALPGVVGDAALIVPVDAGPQGFAAAASRVLCEPRTASILRQRGFVRARGFRPQTVMPALMETYQRAIQEYAHS